MPEDVVVAAGSAVREPVASRELPDVLQWIQLGALWRQRDEDDVAGRGNWSCRPAHWILWRQLVLVAESDFAALELLASLVRRGVTCITRIRFDAAFYDPTLWAEA